MELTPGISYLSTLGESLVLKHVPAGAGVFLFGGK